MTEIKNAMLLALLQGEPVAEPVGTVYIDPQDARLWQQEAEYEKARGDFLVDVIARALIRTDELRDQVAEDPDFAHVVDAIRETLELGAIAEGTRIIEGQQ